MLNLEKYASFIVYRRKYVAFLTGLITIIAVIQALSLRIIIDPNIALPQTHPYVIGTNLVERVFGTNHLLVVGIAPAKGDIYQTAALETVQQFTTALGSIQGVKQNTLLSFSARQAKDIVSDADSLDIRPLMPEVPVTPATLARLREAVARNPIFQNVIVSADGNAAIVTAIVDQGTFGFLNTMTEVYRLVDTLKRPDLKFAVSGPPMYLGQLEKYTARMVYLFPLALLVVGLMHFEAFRTFQGFILPLVTAVLSMVWGLGIMGVFQVPMDAFNIIAPILILAVTAGHAVQLLKRYYDEYDQLIATGMLPRVANQAAVIASTVRVGPVMLASGSVAVASFFSLVTFDIVTIRNFGIFTGLGILSGLIIEMTFIPAIRSWLPPPKQAAERTSRGPWNWLVNVSVRANTGRGSRWILLGTTFVTVASIFCMSELSQENSTKSYFSRDLLFQQADEALNNWSGGTNTLYIAFEGERDDQIKQPAVLRLMAETEEFLNSYPGVGKTSSVVSVIRRLHQAMNNDDPAFDQVPDTSDLVSQYLLLYSMSGDGSELDRYVDYAYRTATITAYLKSDSSVYINGLIRHLDSFFVQKHTSSLQLHIYYGGSVPETAALSEVLVAGKIKNIIQMGIVVMLVSAIIFRSLLAGLIVLAPLLMTVLVNFGFMGLTGIPLNTPNSISSAIAIGIGADYAIYLLYRIPEELDRTGDWTAALAGALTTAGKAVLYVASAIAGGYSVLLLSFGYNVHIWFGILIVLSMVVSAVSALFVIPALIIELKPRFLCRNLAVAPGRGAETGRPEL